ncbi:MAG: hypothetical protein KDK97_07180 [Verrucomicrobiales bacterium]|nr:hypothetical protein [Verrucomicrobiales bacterium]MCP5560226.1 hypothetical protein [Verrucomicrobiaceae bacterium]
MQKKQGNYEKVLLSIAAIIAIGVAGWLYWLSQGFSETLTTRSVAAQNEMGEIPIDKVKQATERFSNVYNWISPERAKKPVPLNKSIRLIYNGSDSLVDLLLEDQPLRPPLTNEFLVKYNLPDLLASNLIDLDPDGDGFSNLEEFKAGTSPRDKMDTPPITDKLFLKERVQHDYIVELRSSQMPVQVGRTAPEPRANRFVEIDKPFGFDKGVNRFIAKKFESKTVKNERTQVEEDKAELVVLDTATNETFVLVKGTPLNLAAYEARFEFWLGTTVQEFTVKKGENFQIPGTGKTFRVISVEEDSAIISSVDGSGNYGPQIPIKRR